MSADQHDHVIYPVQRLDTEESKFSSNNCQIEDGQFKDYDENQPTSNISEATINQNDLKPLKNVKKENEEDVYYRKEKKMIQPYGASESS